MVLDCGSTSSPPQSTGLDAACTDRICMAALNEAARHTIAYCCIGARESIATDAPTAPDSASQLSTADRIVHGDDSYTCICNTNTNTNAHTHTHGCACRGLVMVLFYWCTCFFHILRHTYWERFCNILCYHFHHICMFRCHAFPSEKIFISQHKHCKNPQCGHHKKKHLGVGKNMSTSKSPMFNRVFGKT